MHAALVISAFLVIALYSGLMLWYYVSFRQYRKGPVHPESKFPEGVSVVLPVRDEEENLGGLFSDLVSQEYNRGDCEVIFVDDHSTDQTPVLLGEFCRSHRNFRLLRLQGEQAGKKQAIAAGVEAASGEWIIQADADCRLPQHFIAGHVAAASAGADLVAGPVLVQPEKSLWSRLEALEHFTLTATSIAAAAAGRPVMCSGASLSYSRKFFMEVAAGLHALPHASGDDVFLLAAAKARRRKIHFISEPGMVVTTAPAGGPAAFLRQRTRWGSKARYYRDADMLFLAVLVWVTNATLTGLLLASLFVGGVLWIFLSALTVKSVAEYLLLQEVAGRFMQKHLIVLFPVAALFYYFYITLTGVLSMAGTFSWKGRRYSS
jgi:cellulose synthase/poly-beta-1,6-N-acetylglucosamine synthase-like glycosyltransferase